MNQFWKRMISVLLTLAMLAGLAVPVLADEPAQPTVEELELTEINPETLNVPRLGSDLEEEGILPSEYGLNEMVRVSIVLAAPSTIDQGFAPQGIAQNSGAIAYRNSLKRQQNAMAEKISQEVLGGQRLDVKWNITLAANMISANVPYGKIEQIKALDGVVDVALENRYEPEQGEAADPNTATSSVMIGSGLAWAEGYTGAGSKVAVIDTGIDKDHQSFSGEALEYSLKKNAEEKGVSYEEYVASLNLLDAAKIDELSEQLNSKATGEKAYVSTKIAYAYSYVDDNYDITHENDTQGEHGSHVEGIAAANKYIQKDGEYVEALSEVGVQGVAPDAQIVTMKVFGTGGGAYDSDYMVAIEDAIILGCDSANLSLGSGAAGLGFSGTYETVLNKLVENGLVVTMSAGNNGAWYDNASNAAAIPGYIYSDDVKWHTGGSPGSFTNSLGIASVDNTGSTGKPLQFGDLNVFFTETSGYGNDPIVTLAANGEMEYVLIEGPGVDDNSHVGTTGDQFLALGEDVVKGKIAICYRGTSSFFAKANAAVGQGAIGVIIINNDTGTISMNLTGYNYSAPCVSITQADGAAIVAQSEAVKDEEGNVLYYTGKVKVTDSVQINAAEPTDTVTVSSFSAWGVPGTLVLKPEVLTPGGNIYSVFGYSKTADGYAGGHDEYEIMSGTSMAAPQAAGIAAVLGQYIRENNLTEKTGLSQRQLINSLMMSTAHPVFEDYGSGYGTGYWPVIRVGAGLANVNDAINATSYILMDETSTLFPDSAKDGKVKAELGDDPERTGEYTYSFTVNPLEGEKEFTLRTDLFTQDIFPYNGNIYTDTWTALLSADVTYDVNGESFGNVYKVEADVNGDGKTDAADAQAILDYLTESLAEDAKFDKAAADVDGDGEITSYDARLILESAASPTIEVAEPTKVTVNIKIADDDKAFLDAYYTGGAYIQGYTYIDPASSEEGELLDVVHSIPILAFYGSWTDASMFDRSSRIESAYGTAKTPYFTASANSNYLNLRYADGSTGVYYGNPYAIEDTFPAEKLAMSSDTSLYQANRLIIRNVAGSFAAVQDEAGKVLWSNALGGTAVAPYYSASAGAWQSATAANVTINKTLSSAGAKEGDKVTVGFYALPEYYAILAAKNEETVATSGTITNDQFAKLLESGVIGDGAAIKYTVTVDDTAPVVEGAFRDLITGAITVKAQDDNYIAYVAVTNKSGSKVYAGIVPEQTEAGAAVEVPLDFDGMILPNTVYLLVADYAGNEASFEVKLGGEEVDLGGTMLAFTNSTYLGGGGNRWLEIEGDKLFYYNTTNYEGTSVFASSPVEVRAAEYVDGYVFMAATDGYIYAASIDALDEAQKVGKYSDTTGTIRDMAYNYADGKLYALGANNDFYTVDLSTGALTKVLDVTIVNPRSTSATYKSITNLAISTDGTFYITNYGTGTYAYLYKFTADQAVDGVIADLSAVNPTTAGNLAYYSYSNGGALAWDHNTDTLYFANNYSNTTTGTTLHYLLKIDTQTGKGEKVNTSYAGNYTATYASRLYVKTTGLFIIPGKTAAVTPATEATSLEVTPTELNLLKGQTGELSTLVFPWTLEDKSVTFASADETIATVTADGVVTGIGAGTTTVTVTTTAAPNLTKDVTVTVNEAPSVDITGLIYAEDGTPNWSDFNTSKVAEATTVKSGAAYISGALFDEDTIYTVSDGTMWAVDADTYEAVSLGGISSDWTYADGFGIPGEMADAWGGKVVAPCYNGTYLEVLDPEAGSLSYWNFSTVYANDPMAVLAYGGLYEDGFTYSGTTYDDAFWGLMLTENGVLWRFDFFDGGSVLRTNLGESGVSLGNVSANSGVYASSYYDEESDFLFVSNYQEGETAQIIAINAADPAQNAIVSETAEKVWPVVSLLKHERLTDLALKVNPTDITIYQEQTAALNIKVKLGETNEYDVVVADPTVASYEDGVVTGLKEGTTTITVTTKDTNKEGQTLSATVNVTVKGFKRVDTNVIAQVTDEKGTNFVSVNLEGLTTNVKAAAPGNVTSGARTGDIYMAGVGTAISALDPETFGASEIGYSFSSYYSSYPAQDIANYPEFVDVNGDLDEHKALFTTTLGWLVTPDYYGWNLRSYLPDMAALAFAGTDTTVDEDTDEEVPIYVYWLLTTGGILYEMELDYANGSISWQGVLDTGIRLENQSDASMVFIQDVKLGADYSITTKNAGLVIADNGTKELWYVDFLTGEVGFVGALDAENISGLIGTFDDYASSVTGEQNAVAYPFVTRGDAETRSSSVLATSSLNNTAQITKLGETVNAVSGGLNAAKAEIAKTRFVRTSSGESADGVVTVELTESEATNNGLIAVEYDPTVVTFEKGESKLLNYSINGIEAEPAVDTVQEDTDPADPAPETPDPEPETTENKATVLFAYASVEEIAADDVLATLTFSYDKDADLDTAITVTTLERNENVAVKEEATVLELKVEKHEHNYGEPTYEWSEDNTTVTATVVCIDDETHVVTETVNTTSEVTKEATTEAEGEITYTATFENELFTTQTKVVPTDKLPDEKPGLPCDGGDNCPGNIFTDMPAKGDWAHDPIDWAVVNGITSGATATTFNPNGTCTRAQVVTFLWRAAGEPEAKNTNNPFTDVPADAYYLKAVLWAAENGITSGTSATTFNPNGSCTRGQVVTFLWRYEGEPEAKDATNPFTDVPANAYYLKAVLWAAENGVTTGTSATTFSPNGSCTRAQVVTFLYRDLNKAE